MLTRRYTCFPRDTLTLGAFAINTLQDRHIEPIRLWRNAQLDVLRQTVPLSADEQARYYETSIWPTMSLAEPTNILLSFSEHDQPIGYGGLVHVAWNDRRAEVSFLLAPEYAAAPSEYTSRFAAFLKLIKMLAFDDLRLHRLWTETFATRGDHIKILEANGFQLEGRLREHVSVGGRRVDSLIHGCVAHES